MEDRTSVGLAIVSFIFPIVGLILFFAKKKDTPKAAKSYLIAAVIGFVIGIVLNVIVVTAAGSMAPNTLASTAI